MDPFWDSSWEQVDRERVAGYIGDFDMEPDACIEYLHSRNVKSVCDAGCGCGIYTLKLVMNGFQVSGFDVAAGAVEIARNLLEKAGASAELKTASVLSTGYADEQFDCVISRDVIDHMTKRDAIAAVRELYRITKPGGLLLITLDHLDAEYEEEPHTINNDGDYLFTSGKWEGMVFHPYSAAETAELIPPGGYCHMEENGEYILKIRKREEQVQPSA